MPTSVLRYVASLAVLLAAYGFYALAAVPFIEPEAHFEEGEEPEAEAGDVAKDAMRRQREKLSQLFPEDAWEQNSPKVIASDQARLLFKTYEPQPDGTIKLEPFSLVFFAGSSTAKDKSSGRPVVMRAPLAVLQFDKPLNLGQTDIGRLLGGTMKGEVTITSGESRPGADDALEVVTRNVQLDEEHIWTPHEVRFRYGQSHGSGRDLTITLIPRGKLGDKQKGLGAGGIKALELVHVDKLTLVTGGDGLLPSGDQAEPQTDTTRREVPPPLPVEVMCRGPFRFDFHKLVASFEEHVDVRRLHPGGAIDQLTCQLLELYFDKGTKSAQAVPEKKTNEAPKESALSGLEVQRLVAVGQPVVLKGAQGGASASGQRFEYDLRTRRILLEDGQKATLRHDRHYIESRGLAYEMAESGRLGRLWAAGPGLFRTAVGVDGKQQFEATWEKELRMRPHQGSHVISLTREAGFGFSNQGGMKADEIHVWLREETPDPLAIPAQRLSSLDDKTKAPAVVPDKLLALGNVRIDSAQLSGRAPRLEAWFKTDNSPPSASDGKVRRPGDGISRLPDTTEGSSRLPGEAGPDGQPATPAQKFDITGNIIQIQMVRRGTQTEAENVTVDGHVRLLQLLAKGATEAPLDMRGDTLQIFQATSPDARARMSGRPANVSARGMTMSGANIQLHKGENRVWIDGSGEMTLPAQRNPLAAAVQGRGVESRREEHFRSPVAPGQTITVTWQHRMNFDGQVARFERQVEAKGETQYARGEVLEVTLTRRIDFAQPRSGETVDVQRLAFDGGVFLENRTVEERRLLSIEQLQARKLSVDNINGRLHAVGPGWVSSVRLASAGTPGSPFGGAMGGRKPTVENVSNSPERQPRNSSGGASSNGKPAADGLNYMHVDFQTAIAGNLVKREVQFLDRVTAVYGPVTGWDQQLSPDRLEDLPEQAMLMNCDRLTVTEMGQNHLAQKVHEMEAAGNARVEGKTFTATAERMTYTQAKDLIVLEGDGRSDAELWRQSRVGGPTEHAAARKILFWQRENRAQVDDARFLDLSQFGAPPPREGERK